MWQTTYVQKLCMHCSFCSNYPSTVLIHMSYILSLHLIQVCGRRHRTCEQTVWMRLETVKEQCQWDLCITMPGVCHTCMVSRWVNHSRVFIWEYYRLTVLPPTPNFLVVPCSFIVTAKNVFVNCNKLCDLISVYGCTYWKLHLIVSSSPVRDDYVFSQKNSCAILLTPRFSIFNYHNTPV